MPSSQIEDFTFSPKKETSSEINMVINYYYLISIFLQAEYVLF